MLSHAPCGFILAYSQFTVGLCDGMHVFAFDQCWRYVVIFFRENENAEVVKVITTFLWIIE